MTNLVIQKTVAVVGLGYVGLPLALAFGRNMKTIGFDISEAKLAAYRQGLILQERWKQSVLLPQIKSFLHRIQAN
ncbi:hypothetical protein [uncultured Agitococcus sp.]|uniref:hypothetical protein n=1 Tax=uncultured Agitococcus sp. TaxID=1506599 RepID=UPI00262D0F58|nr:hypothetical protein [uncultured Agitococcus sp.]